MNNISTEQKYMTALDIKEALEGYIPQPWTEQQLAMNSIMTIGQHYFGLEGQTDQITAPILAAIKDLRALNETVDVVSLADMLQERGELEAIGGVITLANILIHFEFVISMGEVNE